MLSSLWNESCNGNSCSWVTFLCIRSVALPNLVHLIIESRRHGGKLDLCVFSWLTGENLSLPVPMEKERIVECRPWQSIPFVLMVGLSWTASFTVDIYTQLTQVSEKGKTVKMEQQGIWGKKILHPINSADIKSNIHYNFCSFFCLIQWSCWKWTIC